MIEFKNGNLLDSTEKYIIHQTNCLSQKAAHLAFDVFKRFPYSDVYSNRKEQDIPGSISIKGNGIDQRFVINLFGQVYPGSPKYPDSTLDGFKIREKYFHQALLKIAKIPNLISVAFPDHIGCGAAGGNWNNYLGTLNNFAKFVHAAQQTRVIIYKL